MDDAAARFDAFVRDHGERLRRALVAAYGPFDGSARLDGLIGYRSAAVPLD